MLLVHVVRKQPDLLTGLSKVEDGKVTSAYVLVET